MAGEWTSVAKAVIKAALATRDRAVMLGHELFEGWEDLVEEVRHERATEAGRSRSALSTASSETSAPSPAPSPEPETPSQEDTPPCASADQE